MGTDAVNLKVQVNDLCLSFRRDKDTRRVLDGLSVSAAAGEFVPILGPSGCGKSTLFNIISGLLPPDALGAGTLRPHDSVGMVGHALAALGESDIGLS